MKIFIFNLLLITVLPLASFSQQEPTYWNIENQHGENILLTISINRETRTFVAHTRKDALKDIAGSIAYMAARTAGILKYPEIVHVEGGISEKSDTIYTDGTFTYLNKSLRFSAKIWQNRLKGFMEEDKNNVFYLNGEKIPSDKPLYDYRIITARAFSLADEYSCDQKRLRSAEWKNFVVDVNKLSPTIADDNELYSTIYWHGHFLSGIDFEIKKNRKNSLEQNTSKATAPVEVKKGTALIDMNNLPEDPQRMEQLFREIRAKGFTSLIIDARGKKPVPVKSVLQLTDHLTRKPSVLGAYFTRKWSGFGVQPPEPGDFEKSVTSFRKLAGGEKELLNAPGGFLKTEPSSSFFSGRVYILVGRKTSGVVEAFAIWMKNEKAGILVGQKSSGSPGITMPVYIDYQYFVPLQVAQFYDRYGKSWINEGVPPDIRVANEDALSYLLKTME